VERPHVAAWTGRAALRGVKGNLSRATLSLTEEAIVVRGRFARLHHLVVPLREVTAVEAIEGATGAVEVRFGASDWGVVARVATSGKPPGDRHVMILNVDDPDAWIREIRQRMGRA
jgi:hypothetical protein